MEPIKLRGKELRDYMRARWTSPDSRPLFCGSLWIGKPDKGCGCAQGDILFLTGYKPWEMHQTDADRIVGELLGTSTAHSVVLRVVNDSKDDCPEKVLDIEGEGIKDILGPNAQDILDFYVYFQNMRQSIIYEESYDEWVKNNLNASGVSAAKALAGLRGMTPVNARAELRAIKELFVGKPGTACKALGFYPKSKKGAN